MPPARTLRKPCRPTRPSERRGARFRETPCRRLKRAARPARRATPRRDGRRDPDRVRRDRAKSRRREPEPAESPPPADGRRTRSRNRLRASLPRPSDPSRRSSTRSQLKKQQALEKKLKAFTRLLRLRGGDQEDPAASGAGDQPGRAEQDPSGEDRGRLGGDRRGARRSCSFRPSIRTPTSSAAARGTRLTRLILPSLEREIRRELTDKAEVHAVSVFARNLRNLLLAAAGPRPPRAGGRSRLQERLQAGRARPVRQRARPRRDLPGRQVEAEGQGQADRRRPDRPLQAQGGGDRQRHRLPRDRGLLRRPDRRAS